ncbi:cell surface protein [Diaphorobacter sp.]|uniref:cell surface protein n=1 Tax=Diaphorobacter sp. TaxID=1934310 RepID=UPI0028AEEDC5|nr:cell surface protein [Diaphorobacter sp.]
MKKNVLALSIATAVVGFAGSAHAITEKVATGTTATALQFSNTGKGHMLLVPYFSTQEGNATLLSLVNTDTTVGKAVKVRFRGAKNSDDIFDFQVFLSPGDVWTANISQNAAGLSFLTTEDNSCTKPSKAEINSTPFVTKRLNQKDADKANGTREGYIEIFNMADIPESDSGVYPLIKHKDGVAKCANDGKNTAWSALDKDRTYLQYTRDAKTAADATDKVPFIGFANPTDGLMANWTIMNVPKALSWSGSAAGIEAVIAGATPRAGAGSLVYFPQMETAASPQQITDFTADPLFATVAPATKPVVKASLYDLPDMSTPYAGAANPLAQADLLSKALAATQVANEFWTEASIEADTDWVFTMPTRRYNVAVDYAPVGAADTPAAIYTTGATYFTTANTEIDGDAICVNDVTSFIWDREEGTTVSGPVISPGNTAAPFCGEVSVLGFNDAGSTTSAVVSGKVALKHLDTGKFVNGWGGLVTPGNDDLGLPVLGTSFVKAYNPAAAEGVAGNYGISWSHRYTRPAP